jgi:hypothetical protein
MCTWAPGCGSDGNVGWSLNSDDGLQNVWLGKDSNKYRGCAYTEHSDGYVNKKVPELMDGLNLPSSKEFGGAFVIVGHSDKMNNRQ